MKPKTRKEKLQLLNSLKARKISASDFIELNDNRPYQPPKLYIQDVNNPDLFKCPDGTIKSYSEIQEESKGERKSKYITAIFIISAQRHYSIKDNSAKIDFRLAE